MPRVIQFEGREIQVPDAATDEQVATILRVSSVDARFPQIAEARRLKRETPPDPLSPVALDRARREPTPTGQVAFDPSGETEITSSGFSSGLGPESAAVGAARRKREAIRLATQIDGMTPTQALDAFERAPDAGAKVDAYLRQRAEDFEREIGERGGSVRAGRAGRAVAGPFAPSRMAQAFRGGLSGPKEGPTRAEAKEAELAAYQRDRDGFWANFFTEAVPGAVGAAGRTLLGASVAGALPSAFVEGAASAPEGERIRGGGEMAAMVGLGTTGTRLLAPPGSSALRTLAGATGAGVAAEATVTGDVTPEGVLLNPLLAGPDIVARARQGRNQRIQDRQALGGGDMVGRPGPVQSAEAPTAPPRTPADPSAPARTPEPVGAVEERGALSFLKRPLEEAWEMGKSVLSGLRSSMIGRAARGGAEGKGGSEAADVAQRLQKAAHETRAAEGHAADAFRAEQADQRIFGQKGRARARLETPVRVPGKDYYKTPIREIVEGREPARDPAEAAMAKNRQDLILRMGEIEVADNVKVPDRPVAHGGTGKMVDFVNRAGVEPRNPARLLRDLLRNKNHPQRQQAAEAYADLNKMPVTEVEAIFDEMAMDYGETGGGAKERTTQSEHRRYFEQTPTHLHVKGRPEPLYEERVGHYGRAFLHGRAARVGFRRAFGQDFALTPTGQLLRYPTGVGHPKAGQVVSPIDEMGERYGKETSRPDVFHESVRAGSGRPVEAEPVTSKTQAALTHVGKGALNLYKAGKLSATALYNVLEPLVRVPEAGVVNTVRAYGEAVASGMQRLTGGRLGSGYREIFKALERHGAIDVSGRVSTHGGVQGIGARAMQLRAEQMQARATQPDATAAAIDAGRLRGMGYDAPTAERLSTGRGTATEYRDLINRTVPRTTGQRMTAQEQMRGEHSRAVKVLFPIMRFAARQAAIVGNAGKAWAQSLKNTAQHPAQWRDAVSSSKHLVETLGVHGLVGAGQIMVYSLAYGGKAGLEATIARFADDPAKAFAQGFLSNALGGPLGSMMAAMRGDRDLASGIFPIAFAREVGDLIEGDGKYRDLPWSERAQTFLKGAVPAVRVAETALTGAISLFTGKPDREQEWREAIKAYRGWVRDDKVPDARFYRMNPNDADERFATAMRKAYRAMLQGKSPDDVEALLTEGLSVEGKGGRNLKSALEARMILADDEVQKRLPALKARVGERAFKNLQAHDELLQGLIDAVETRGRSRATNRSREKPQPGVDREATRRALESAR